MSTEFTSRAGISDPTLPWIEQANALLDAPGIDPTEVLQDGAEMVPDAGYLITSTVYPGTGMASTRLCRFEKGELKLYDPNTHANGTRSVTAEFSRPGMCVVVACGNISDRLPDDEPGFAAVTSGEAKVTTNKWNGFFVAETGPSTLLADRLSVASYYPDPNDGRYQVGNEKPAQLLRIVNSKEDAESVAEAIARGAGLDDIQQYFYATKVNEKLTNLKWALFDRNEAENPPAERSGFAAYVAGVLRNALGIRPTDKA